MQRRIIGTLGIASLLLTGSVAIAGYKSTEEVAVAVGSGGTYKYAAGQVGTARGTADSNQYIRCSLEMGTSSKTIRCRAADVTLTNFLECTTGNNDMALAVASIGSNSRVRFTVGKNADGSWSGTCSSIHIHNGSQYQPITP